MEPQVSIQGFRQVSSLAVVEPHLKLSQTQEEALRVIRQSVAPCM